MASGTSHKKLSENKHWLFIVLQCTWIKRFMDCVISFSGIVVLLLKATKLPASNSVENLNCVQFPYATNTTMANQTNSVDGVNGTMVIFVRCLTQCSMWNNGTKNLSYMFQIWNVHAKLISKHHCPNIQIRLVLNLLSQKTHRNFPITSNLPLIIK